MHLMFTVKFIVLTVAFATQCVYAKSQNEYGYFNEKFCVLAWITYLKRLSLIALTLCGIVLYYVPKSRSYARRECCILIDTVANGLKFVLNIDEIEHEKIKEKYENENKELRIQEVYRKIYKEDTRNVQKYINKTNLDNDNHKSIKKHKSKKFRAKHTIDKKHERHRHNRHHQNAINNMLPESNAMITANSPQQITIIDEKCKKGNMVILQDTALKTRITTCTMPADKLKNNTDSRQENSLKKADSSMISEIINKNNTKKFKTPSQKQQNMSNVNINVKKENKQNFDCMKHEKVTVLSQRQSNKDFVTMIINKQMDFCYEKLFTKRHDKFQTKSFTHDCYENSSITNRVKPVLLRVVNWFFGGCPEASKRHREQIDEVGKEEIFESTNTWLL